MTKEVNVTVSLTTNHLVSFLVFIIRSAMKVKPFFFMFYQPFLNCARNNILIDHIG